MANPEHLKILRRGVKDWNEWRKNNPQVIITDLSGADFSGEDLREIDFGGANLEGANLEGANIQRGNFTWAAAERVNLERADLSGATFGISNFSEANFQGANLAGASLSATNLRGVKLNRANLLQATLYEAKLEEANLSDVCLVRTQVHNANFNKAILTGVCIEDWSFNSHTNFENIKCEYVYLRWEYSPVKMEYFPKKNFPSNRKFELGEFNKLFRADRGYSKLSILEALINRFERLLDEYPQGNESLFHNFLIENPALLDIYGVPISKPQFFYPQEESPLGKKYVEPDVIIRYPGNKYKLVELEKPSKRLGTKQGQPTSQLNQAAFQITEWDDYIREYYYLIKNDYPGISSHRSGMVVIGRRTAKSVGLGRDIKRYMQLIVNQYPCEVCFYDDLLDKAKQAYEALVALSL